MGKITVKHYLNKRLRASFFNNALEYPVYVRVSYGRKNERIKSDWIVHPCSEYDFENNEHIIKLKEYESEIINDIIEMSGDNDFDLSARLGCSQDYITELFKDFMFDKNEIKEQVINYVSEKANISKSILNPYFRNELSFEGWRELYEKNVFNDETKEKVIYLSMLLEFEEENYPPLPQTVMGYRAGCDFVFHEWKNKKKEIEFLEFAKKKNILPLSKTQKITKEFNNKILINNTSDFRIEIKHKGKK